MSLVRSFLEILNILALEFGLQRVNFRKQTLNFSLDLKGDASKFHVVLVAQFALVDPLYQILAVLETSPDLVGKPRGDWCAARRSGVFCVVYNVLFSHNPVLVSEAERHVDVAQHKQGRLTVFLAILFEIGRFVLMGGPVDVRLVVQRSVGA